MHRDCKKCFVSNHKYIGWTVSNIPGWTGVVWSPGHYALRATPPSWPGSPLFWSTPPPGLPNPSSVPEPFPSPHLAIASVLLSSAQNINTSQKECNSLNSATFLSKMLLLLEESMNYETWWSMFTADRNNTVIKTQAQIPVQEWVKTYSVNLEHAETSHETVTKSAYYKTKPQNTHKFKVGFNKDLIHVLTTLWLGFPRSVPAVPLVRQLSRYCHSFFAFGRQQFLPSWSAESSAAARSLFPAPEKRQATYTFITNISTSQTLRVPIFQAYSIHPILSVNWL